MTYSPKEAAREGLGVQIPHSKTSQGETRTDKRELSRENRRPPRLKTIFPVRLAEWLATRSRARLDNGTKLETAEWAWLRGTDERRSRRKRRWR